MGSIQWAVLFTLQGPVVSDEARTHLKIFVLFQIVCGCVWCMCMLECGDLRSQKRVLDPLGWSYRQL